MLRMSVLGWSHVGICCSDLERSTRFYEQVLGFEQVFTMELSVPATMEVDGTFASRMLRRPDMRLELLQWLSVDPTGDGSRRSMLGLGLTHLAFRVASYDDVLPAVEAHGGTVHRHTLTELDGGVQLLYATDPDGTRLELMVGTPDFS